MTFHPYLFKYWQLHYVDWRIDCLTLEDFLHLLLAKITSCDHYWQLLQIAVEFSGCLEKQQQGYTEEWRTHVDSDSPISHDRNILLTCYLAYLAGYIMCWFLQSLTKLQWQHRTSTESRSQRNYDGYYTIPHGSP
jgi:hypothetical protein